METTDILVVIPARGGSKRIKHKNLLPIGDTPLVAIAIETALAAKRLLAVTDIKLRVIVSTDDDQIANLAGMNCEVYRRIAPSSDDETIGDMLGEIIADMEWDGPVMVMQPTSVPDHQKVVDLVQDWVDEGCFEYCSTVTPKTGLYWGPDQEKLYGDRLNSQQLGPIVWEENGAVRLYPAGDYDFNRDPDDIRELSVTDIDTWGDLQQVRSQHNRGTVVFDIVAMEKTGAGHLYRCMSIAQELQNHDVMFNGNGLMDEWAVDTLKSHGWTVTLLPVFIPDTGGDYGGMVWVNDRLNTTAQHVAAKIRDGWKVVNIEDEGPGVKHADLVINAMYTANQPHEVGGPDWAVIRPEFFADRWEYDPYGTQVLVLFGGTDPKDMTYQVSEALADCGLTVGVMTGPGYRGAYEGPVFRGSVASAMKWSDLLVTSGGRTVYEAAAIGIPTVVIAQNLRETTHKHLGPRNGNLYLGLADTVTKDKIRETVEGLMLFPEPRVEMSERSKSMVDGKGVRRIVRRIEDLLEGL